jgi:hypothetical protein
MQSCELSRWTLNLYKSQVSSVFQRPTPFKDAGQQSPAFSENLAEVVLVGSQFCFVGSFTY